jgi:uncharacterized protein YkuJ
LKSVEDVSNSGDLSVGDESNFLFKLYCFFLGGAELPFSLQPVLRKEGAKTMQVNFSRNLAQIIREIKYLDAMGFHLPEFALSVTLQEDKYDLDVESLENMLEVHV